MACVASKATHAKMPVNVTLCHVKYMHCCDKLVRHIDIKINFNRMSAVNQLISILTLIPLTSQTIYRLSSHIHEKIRRSLAIFILEAKLSNRANFAHSEIYQRVGFNVMTS